MSGFWSSPGHIEYGTPGKEEVWRKGTSFARIGLLLVVVGIVPGSEARVIEDCMVCVCHGSGCSSWYAADIHPVPMEWSYASDIVFLCRSRPEIEVLSSPDILWTAVTILVETPAPYS